MTVPPLNTLSKAACRKIQTETLPSLAGPLLAPPPVVRKRLALLVSFTPAAALRPMDAA